MSSTDTTKLDFFLTVSLPYELWMLDETFKRLNEPLTDQVIANALIESFCIHARQLIDFFENR